MAAERKRREAAYGPLDYSRRWSLRAVFLVTLVFLYVPILSLRVHPRGRASRRPGEGGH